MHRLFLAPLPATPSLQIAGLAGIALALRLIQELLNTARKLLRTRIEYNGVLRVRCDLFRKMQALHLGYHRSQPVGDSIFRLTTDTFGCAMVLGVLLGIVFAVVTLWFILGIQLARSAMLTLIALAAVPPLIWANVRFGRRLENRTIAAKQADSAYTSSVQRALTAIGLMQAFGREEDVRDRFAERAEAVRKETMRQASVEARFLPGLIFLPTLGIAAVLYVGGREAIAGNLTIGEFTLFVTLLLQLVWPLEALGWIINLAQRATAAASRSFAWLDGIESMPEPASPVPLPSGPLQVRFERFDPSAVGREIVLASDLLVRGDLRRSDGFGNERGIEHGGLEEHRKLVGRIAVLKIVVS